MRGILACLVGLIALPGVALANCGQPREVVAGETLLSLAAEVYGDAEQWALIYQANQAILDDSGFRLTPGMALQLPCPPGQEITRGAITPLQQLDAELKLVTGSNFAPFTDTAWPGQGMVTELVHAALDMTPAPVSYAIAWENDWSQHLAPILAEKRADMGFPWYKPDCARTPENFRCANFHFSDPLIDVQIMLFVRADSGLRFDSDADIEGKRLCRPQGYFTFDLDRSGREWLSLGKIDLVQPATPQACMQALMAGQVDAVTLNIFTGAEAIDAMELRGRVVPLERPLSSEGLHVVISKSHWRGTTHLYRFNAGLQALRETARYDEIVARHLGVFWDQIRAD